MIQELRKKMTGGLQAVTPRVRAAVPVSIQSRPRLSGGVLAGAAALVVGVVLMRRRNKRSS